MGVEIVCGFKLLRELGARALPSYAALDPKPRRPEDALCVVERLARGTGAGAVAGTDPAAAAVFLRDAKRLTQLRHPHLVHVRDVVLGASDVLLVTDWVDGEVLSDVQRIAARQGVLIPLAGGLRIVVDLLEGLSALHEVSDAKREPLRIVHAEVAPRNIVVGVDGRAVLVHPLHAPAGRGGAEAATGTRTHSPDVLGYLAPEVLLGDQTADQRADVYGAGVLLWEALSGARMHPEGEEAGEIVMRLLGGRIGAPSAPADAPWALPLVDVAKRAVSPDPSVRFADAGAMLAEVQRIAGARLAPKLTVAALVEAVAGDRIRARPLQLGVKRSVARLPSESAWTTEAATSRTPSAPSAPEAFPSEEDPTKPPPSKVLAAPEPASHPSIPVTEGPVVHGSEPPSSAEVLELEDDAATRNVQIPPQFVARRANVAAPPLPPRPQAAPKPPAPHAQLRVDTPMTDSRTDMAAAIAPAVAPSASARARAVWTIALACAVGGGAILWMLLRAPGDPAVSTDPPAASLAPSAAPTSIAQEAPAPPLLPASAASSPPPPPPSAPEPPIPTVTASPVAPTPAPPAAPAPSPPPSVSSPHPKKRVYDPMGI